MSAGCFVVHSLHAQNEITNNNNNNNNNNTLFVLNKDNNYTIKSNLSSFKHYVLSLDVVLTPTFLPSAFCTIFAYFLR